MSNFTNAFMTSKAVSQLSNTVTSVLSGKSMRSQFQTR